MSSSAGVSEGLKSCLSVEIPQVHLSSRPALIPAKVRCHNLQLENVKVTRVTHKRCMISCDCMGIPQNSLTAIGPYLGKLGNSKIEEWKKRGKRDGRRTDHVTISVMPQFHRTLLPAPLSNNPHPCAIQSPIMDVTAWSTSCCMRWCCHNWW